jgi:cell division transport system ATP-binding protein
MLMDRRQDQVFHNKELRQNPQAFLLDNVSMKYGNFVALQSIQLSISVGEILFVTGASGAGKTSLMNLLAGHIDPTSGRVLKKSGLFTSYVFQDLRMMNQKTCEDNLWLAFDKSIYKNKNEFYTEMTELSKLMGVWDKLSLKVNEANGGLKQKMSMIRALLTRPQVLLADEPTSMLDRNSAINMFEILNYYNTKRGLTIIWSTHNKDLIKQFPGRLIHLDQGKLVYSGQACFI